MVPISKSKLIPPTLAVAMALLSWGCKKEPVAAPKAAETAPAAARNPLEITITSEIAKQIRIGEPTWQQVTGSFRATGRVEADERRITRVSAPVGGRVAELLVQPGETVKKGQILAVLRSPELSEAQSQLLNNCWMPVSSGPRNCSAARPNSPRPTERSRVFRINFDSSV